MREPQCAVVFCSSDNTLDVARLVLPVLDHQWPDCPFQKYLLLSTSDQIWLPENWGLILAGSTAGWRTELLSGIRQLPPNVSHVLLFLDDFLVLRPISSAAVVEAVSIAVRSGYGYLRLRPVERTVFARLALSFVLREKIEPLSGSEPYYSSLQVAIWERGHLETMLQMPGSIWDFEHQKLVGVVHFAVTRMLIDYVHVVEKGRWMPYAQRYFRRCGIFFDSGSRSKWGWRYGIIHIVRKLRFALFGYLFMRLKLRLKL